MDIINGIIVPNLGPALKIIAFLTTTVVVADYTVTVIPDIVDTVWDLLNGRTGVGDVAVGIKDDVISRAEENTDGKEKTKEDTKKRDKAGQKELPENPDDLLEEGWKETTHPDNNSGSREFVNPKTGEKVRFDPGKKGADGWRGKDHYHRYNPNSTGKHDLYLDKNGNPVGKNSRPSHLPPSRR